MEVIDQNELYVQNYRFSDFFLTFLLLLNEFVFRLHKAMSIQ